MSRMPSSPNRSSPAARFRVQIEQAHADGVAHEDMTLHLTLTDVHRLQRDAAIPVADISFAGGVMRYLGVRVEQGGVDASRLDRENGAVST
jgi:hypothetical protein